MVNDIGVYEHLRDCPQHAREFLQQFKDHSHGYFDQIQLDQWDEEEVTHHATEFYRTLAEDLSWASKLKYHGELH